MVTISPALQEKIERRARRAFSRFDEGSSPRLHRISSLGADRLNYRIPRSGRKTVAVVRSDNGDILVDPPTTDARDLLTTSDIGKLKNNTGKLHQGEITGYILVTKVKKVGKTYKKTDGVMSRKRAEEGARRDNFVYAVKLMAGDLKDISHDSCEANSYVVEEQLDPVKDLGLTDGLLDCQTTDDIKKLPRHVGRIRAYMKVGAATTFQLATYQVPSEPLTSLDKVTEGFKVGDHAYAVEVDYDDTNLDKGGSYEFVSRGDWEVVEELDLAALGFTTGVLDLKTKADVIALRKKKHLGRVRAYKYTTKDAESPIQSPKIKYEVGKDYEIKDADTDPASNCHKGINVADVEWTKGSASGDRRVFAFEFEMEDIAAIPTHTDGKFRVHRCKCVEELDPKTFKPLPPPKRALESGGTQKKPKKKGFMDKLLGRGDDE